MHTHTSIAIALSLLSYSTLHAQSEAPAPDPADGASTFQISASASERILFRTDFDGAPADVSTARTDLGLLISGELSEDFSLSLGLSGIFSQYDFGGALAPLLSGTNALEDGIELGVRLSGRYTINETWSALGGVFTRAGFDQSADLDDAFTFGGFAAAGYKHSDTFSIDFGLLLSTRLEDDEFIIPYIAIDWAINDTLTLTTTGLGARLEAKIDDQWAVYLAGRYETHEYRLDDAFVALPGGVVRDESFPIGVGIRYAPNSSFSLSVEGGIVIEREFEFFDSAENEIATIEIDSGAYLGLSLAFSF